MKPVSLQRWVSTSVVVGLIFGSVSGFDYCTVPCVTRTQTNKHTMCLYPREAPGSLCRGFDAKMELTVSDKDLLVKLHNQLRSQVARGKETRGSPGPQPPAANMKELVWDYELETIARRWALQCDYKHDKCRQTKSKEYVGQNLAVSYDSRGFMNDLEKMVTSWYDEVELAPNRIAQSFSSSAVSGTIGHYTQIVWAETSRIGCARVFFQFSDWGLTEYLVCNYAQGGNVKSAPIYAIGKHCSSCSSGLKCSLKYSGLCSNPPPNESTTNKAIMYTPDESKANKDIIDTPEESKADKDIIDTSDYEESDDIGTEASRIDDGDDNDEGVTHSPNADEVMNRAHSAATPTDAVVWKTVLKSVLAILVVKFFV